MSICNVGGGLFVGDRILFFMQPQHPVGELDWVTDLVWGILH